MRLLLALLVLPGCSHLQPEPRTAIDAWSSALARDDPHAAYSLLAASERAHVSEADFAARWRGTADERRRQATALQPPTTAVVETAQLRLADGRSLPLVREAAGWRLAAARVVPPGAPSPEEALRRFVQALRAHDFDAILTLLAEPLRTVVEREVADRVTQLQSPPKLHVEGDRAQIRTERFHIDLIRENGQWRVADFN